MPRPRLHNPMSKTPPRSFSTTNDQCFSPSTSMMEGRTVFGARSAAVGVVRVPQHRLSTRIIGRQCLPFAIHRYYATSNTLAGTTKPSSRKQVTIGNDDGRVPWGQLSTGEKAARTTQQTFNLGVILAGAVGLVWRFSSRLVRD